jgi:pectin methylesterase-like acyl-CoA thioesterase
LACPNERSGARIDTVKDTSRSPRTIAVRRIALGCAAGILLAACGGSSIIKGSIKDDAITLSTDHAGATVRFELQNTGATPCDLFVGLTSLSVDALPLKDGRVVITNADPGPGIVRPITTYENSEPYSLGRVQPGASFSIEIALEGAPRAEERVLLCNGPGDYEHRRYAILRFDR